MRLIFKYLLELSPWKGRILLSLCLSLFAVGLELLPVLLTKILVDDVYPSKDMTAFQLVLAAMVVVYIVQFFINWQGSVITQSCAEGYLQDLRHRVFARVLGAPLEKLQMHSDAELCPTTRGKAGRPKDPLSLRV